VSLESLYVMERFLYGSIHKVRTPEDRMRSAKAYGSVRGSGGGGVSAPKHTLW